MPKTKKIIWNDNIETDNYELGFENENGQLPDTITLFNKDDDRGAEAAVKWRFDFVSQQYVDSANQTQDNRLDAIEALNVTQNNRLDAIETLNQTQDTRLDAIETLNQTQDTRLDAIETLNTTQDNRLDAIEQKNTEQDNALQDIVGVNGQQSGRLTILEDEIKNDITDVFEKNFAFNVVKNDGIYEAYSNIVVHFNDSTSESIAVTGHFFRKTYDSNAYSYFLLMSKDLENAHYGNAYAVFVNDSATVKVLTTRELFKKIVDVSITDFDCRLISDTFDKRILDDYATDIELQNAIDNLRQNVLANHNLLNFYTKTDIDTMLNNIQGLNIISGVPRLYNVKEWIDHITKNLNRFAKNQITNANNYFRNVHPAVTINSAETIAHRLRDIVRVRISIDTSQTQTATFYKLFEFTETNLVNITNVPHAIFYVSNGVTVNNISIHTNVSNETNAYINVTGSGQIQLFMDFERLGG